MAEKPKEKDVDEARETRTKAEGDASNVKSDSAASKPSEQASTRPPLPEPSLRTFVSGLAGQVLINLGLFENPSTGRREQDLEQAKYSVDLLQLLKDKMRGNLIDEEEKFINTVLYDLRMRYVEACR